MEGELKSAKSSKGESKCSFLTCFRAKGYIYLYMTGERNTLSQVAYSELEHLGWNCVSDPLFSMLTTMSHSL